ncbi:carboxymuconolactone decarboxylase family protein [candidate division KSB1 bacterium]
MNIGLFNKDREELNNVMNSEDEFFRQFGDLDDRVYSDGAIPKKYKELTGLSISVLSRCNECITYHIQNCLKEKASKEEVVEAIKIGVIGGGSVAYPSARHAFRILKELNVIEKQD